MTLLKHLVEVLYLLSPKTTHRINTTLKAQTNRRTHTLIDRKTGPIPLPQPLTQEVKDVHVCGNQTDYYSESNIFSLNQHCTNV